MLHGPVAIPRHTRTPCTLTAPHDDPVAGCPDARCNMQHRAATRRDATRRRYDCWMANMRGNVYSSGRWGRWSRGEHGRTLADAGASGERTRSSRRAGDVSLLVGGGGGLPWGVHKCAFVHLWWGSARRCSALGAVHRRAHPPLGARPVHCRPVAGAELRSSPNPSKPLTLNPTVLSNLNLQHLEA